MLTYQREGIEEAGVDDADASAQICPRIDRTCKNIMISPSPFIFRLAQLSPVTMFLIRFGYEIRKPVCDWWGSITYHIPQSWIASTWRRTRCRTSTCSAPPGLPSEIKDQLLILVCLRANTLLFSQNSLTKYGISFTNALKAMNFAELLICDDCSLVKNKNKWMIMTFWMADHRHLPSISSSLMYDCCNSCF